MRRPGPFATLVLLALLAPAAAQPAAAEQAAPTRAQTQQVLTAMDKAFNAGDLDAFLTDPKGYLPGTKMAFKGIKKATDRANLIAYMRQSHDNPPALPAE